MSETLLTVEQWDTFFERLGGPEGCDFQEREPGNPETVTWNCKGGFDKTYSRAILQTMEFPPAVIDAVLAYVTDYGGHCDCEILFNAVERVYEDLGITLEA